MTQSMPRAGEIPGKWCSENRLTSLKGAGEGDCRNTEGSAGPQLAGWPAEVNGASSKSYSWSEKEVCECTPRRKGALRISHSLPVS